MSYYFKYRGPYRRYRYYHHRRRSEPNALGAFSALLFLLALGLYLSKGAEFLGAIIGGLFLVVVVIVFVVVIKKLFRRKNKSDTSSVSTPQTTFIDRPVLDYPVDETNVEESASEEDTSPRYELKRFVSEAEDNFLKVLEEVVSNRYRIVPQVQLSRIMRPIDSNQHFTNYHDFNLIKAKSVDFVLYDQNLIKPYLAIELDDRSHLKEDRIKRDEFVNKVMSDIGLRLIRIATSYSYDKEELKRKIFPDSL